MIFYAATTNKNKLREIQEILAPLGISVETHPHYAALIVEETGSTFEENVAIKALALSNLADGYVIADDSGLAADVLNGAPGIYSARYAGEGATDEKNNELLLKNLAGKTNRNGRFICAIAFAKNNKIINIFRGECAGHIAFAPKGSGGFGYDPLFVLPDGRTMAELSAAEKNAVSHRRKALEQLAEFLKGYLK